MCKSINNAVVGNMLTLGNRLVGYSIYDLELGEIILASAKDIRDMLNEGKSIKGFRLSDDGKTVELEEDVNIPKVSGLTTSTLKPINGMVSEIFTLVEKAANGDCGFINSRFGRKTMQESQIRSLLDLGAVINGVRLEGKALVTWFDGAEEKQSKQK